MPNNSARNLKRNDAKAIAVLVKGIGNTFFSELVGILERECEKKGYSCILQYVDEQEDEWDVAIRVGKEKRLRGLVFLGGSFSQSQERSVRWRFPAYSVPSVRWGCRVHPWLPYRWMILRKAIR
mgnify:CR=1 FL=1